MATTIPSFALSGTIFHVLCHTIYQYLLSLICNSWFIFPSFLAKEIIIGKKVGLGGFSKVCSVDSIELNELFDISEVASDARSNFAASTTEKQYVIKKIRADLPEEECVKGIVDLAIEASFLSTLCHSNIISLRALSNSDPHEAKFFVILDRLITTLERTFNRWRKEVGENSGYWFGPFGYCCAKEPCLYQTWYERLKASRDIANAIYYLHSNNMVYRGKNRLNGIVYTRYC